jgi:hypothetical protein
VGGFADDEIPLLPMLFYLFRDVASSRPHGRLVLGLSAGIRRRELRGRQRQVGSLAGAAHLLNDNTGVLRLAQREQKSLVEQKGKS